MTKPANASKWFSFNTDHLVDYQKACFGEAVNLFGWNCKYLPIEFVEGDINWVFGEIPKIKYTQAFDLRIHIVGYKELYEAIGDYTKFGMLLMPEGLKATVGKDDYRSIVIDGSGNFINPHPGDLIMFRIHKDDIILEVTDVGLMFDSYYDLDLKLYNYDALTTISTDTPADNIDIPEDFPSDNNNEKIEEQNEQYQDHTKRHQTWGAY